MAKAATGAGITGGDAPIVLLPGTLCDAAVFATLRAALAVRGRDTQVMPLPVADTIDAAVRDLVVRLPDRCVLVGFSLGGIVALHLALHAPDRVAGLVLVAATARAAVPGVVMPNEGAFDAHVTRHLVPRYFDHAPADAATLRADVRAMALRCGPAMLERQLRLASGRPDARARLCELAMPVLVLGGAEDRINPPAVQRELADTIPHATLAIVAGTGHFPLLEAPAQCADTIHRWLAATSSNEGMAA